MHLQAFDIASVSVPHMNANHLTSQLAEDASMRAILFHSAERAACIKSASRSADSDH